MSTAGKLAAHTWLHARGLVAATAAPWHVEILLVAQPGEDAQFRIEIYSEEWGVFFAHRHKASWIRVTDIAFVHGRDDFALLPHVRSLADVGALLREVEAQYALGFPRARPLVRTNLASADAPVRAWVRSL